MKTLIIIPAYNEASVIFTTLKELKAFLAKAYAADILVVNDGSTDATVDEAARAGVAVVTHILNRGLGGAIGTGLAYARKHKYELAVTFDADGQHEPNDIPTILEPITAGRADVVIGSRFADPSKEMPLDRKVLLRISNLLTYILFGAYTTDSLSGFRAFNKKAINGIEIKTERMEVSNELFSEIKRLKLRLSEVPIRVIYTDYSRSKGQTNTNGINIVFKLLLRLFR